MAKWQERIDDEAKGGDGNGKQARRAQGNWIDAHGITTRRIPKAVPNWRGGCARGRVHFRVWAPGSKAVGLELREVSPRSDPALRDGYEFKKEGDGYFSVLAPEASEGMVYKFRLKSGSFPDPASRFQPEGPHGPSQIVDAKSFKWSDAKWKGIRGDGQVIYEMHVGTFTHEGTWKAAMEQLAELARVGITVVEVMPVADFPGWFGWGYDGVNLFAPTRLNGGPDDFRAFVDRAHALGLGVILDVVYNHFGPDGNYLKEFSPDYLTDRHFNEWGEAINFDGPQSGPVREFFYFQCPLLE